MQANRSTSPSKRRKNTVPASQTDSRNEREPNSIKISDHLQSLISTAAIGGIDGEADDDGNDGANEGSRTELDSHANMPVVGQNAFVISDTGRMADVKPYSPDYESMAIPIVDAAVRYDCPYDSLTYILVIRNALHLPSMQTNLIPPFIMREAGITVHDTPKMQMDDPTTEDHSIYFPETRFRIPMSLWGIFSYFQTSKPSVQDMTGCEEVYMLTPSRWDPHQESYATNESNMLDWEGNLTTQQDRQQILLSEIQEDGIMAASVSIGSIEVLAIDAAMERGTEDYTGTPHPQYQRVPGAADQISSILGGSIPDAQ
jgi:hypothetical protein